MISVITGSLLADMQIHKKGYVDSIDNLPLNIFLTPAKVEKASKVLNNNPDVVASSPRIKFSAMLSKQTSGTRLVAITPDKESKTCPDLIKRIKGKNESGPFLKPGEIIVPDLLYKGLSLKLGDEVVIVATNRDGGAVNGITLRIARHAEGVLGPSGKDGYIHHIDDATNLLRMETPEISEIAIRLKEFKYLNRSHEKLNSDLKGGLFEVHTREQLTPFQR